MLITRHAAGLVMAVITDHDKLEEATAIVELDHNVPLNSPARPEVKGLRCYVHLDEEPFSEQDPTVRTAEEAARQIMTYVDALLGERGYHFLVSKVIFTDNSQVFKGEFPA